MIRYINISSKSTFPSTSFDLYLAPLEEDYRRARRPLRFPHLSDLYPRGPFSDVIEYNRYVANELRRIFESEVPCLAFDEVDITVNTSSFPEEFIAHRLSFISIPSDSIESERVATLRARGKCDVNSSQIELDGEYFIEDSSLICPLRLGEELELTAIVRLGTAQDHIKWSPISAVGFKEIDPNRFRFTLEEAGSLSTPEIIKRAAITLEERCGVVLYGF